MTFLGNVSRAHQQVSLPSYKKIQQHLSGGPARNKTAACRHSSRVYKSSHRLWNFSRQRWMTGREKWGAMGWPVWPDVAAAMNVDMVDVKQHRHPYYLVGNSVPFRCLLCRFVGSPFSCYPNVLCRRPVESPHPPHPHPNPHPHPRHHPP